MSLTKHVLDVAKVKISNQEIDMSEEICIQYDIYIYNTTYHNIYQLKLMIWESFQ